MWIHRKEVFSFEKVLDWKENVHIFKPVSLYKRQIVKLVLGRAGIEIQCRI